jgi:hypothetical protein
METGPLESADGVEPLAGVAGLDGVEESVEGPGGTVGEVVESEVAPGSAWVPMWRGM